MTYKVERLWGGFGVILWLFKAFEIIPNAQRYEAGPYSEEIIRVSIPALTLGARRERSPRGREHAVCRVTLGRSFDSWLV